MFERMPLHIRRPNRAKLSARLRSQFNVEGPLSLASASRRCRIRSGGCGIHHRQSDSRKRIFRPTIRANLAGQTASGFFLALERLVIPMTVAIEHLALFAVAVSLVGSPFHVIQKVISLPISGILNVLSSFSTSVVNALASGAGLRLLSASSWVCVVLAALLAYAGRSWGLCGVNYGVALGWLARCAVAFWISAPLLRR